MWNPEFLYGYLSPNEGAALRRLSAGADVLELGAFCGKSAAFIAPVAKRLVCVDPFTADYGGQGDLGFPASLPYFLCVTHQFKNIITIIAKSHDVMHLFPDNSLDLLFVDSNHTYEDTKAEILGYGKKLKEGGILACHDYYDGFPGTMRAINEFAPPSEVIDVLAITPKRNIRFEG